MNKIILFLAAACLCTPAWSDVRDDGEMLHIATADYRLDIVKKGFRFGFAKPDGTVIAPPHASSGLAFSGGVADSVRLVSQAGDRVALEVTNDKGRSATVEIEAGARAVRFAVKAGEADRILARTGGLSPAFGLADHAAFDLMRTDVTSYTNDAFRAQQPPGHKRLVSNFVIFPRQGFAMVNMENGPKIVRVKSDQVAQGVVSAREMPALYCFIGTPPEIYAAFQEARIREGYPVFKPKFEFFGVGWEAFGALGWKTNEKTVTENVERYLELGYPLEWMVVGSGFWPNEDPAKCATTSFGLWDNVRYPDPRRFIRHFKDRGLKFFLGLRISFIENGPYSAEGVGKGYFLKEDGKAKAYKIAFPKLPAYLLDGENPAAVKWYLDLCQKWMDAGVDGFKEDLFGYGVVRMREGNIDAVNRALMDKGVYVMGRNTYLSSASDTHRIEDFNFDQNQDRGPVNCLAFSYCGFAYGYPDITGGTFGEGRKMPPLDSPRMQKYMMRVAQFDSVCPSMAMGMGPWNFGSPQVEKVMLEAAQLHGRLHPYIYSAVVDAFETGFPHSMAPLPLVFPDDPRVYGRENAEVRGYEWMIGPSLLATPLYGNDYETAEARDVYLPAGAWMDFDTGETYQGPRLLEKFALPCGKTPLFVGGKGVLVLRDLKDKSLRAAVYPVAPAGSSYRFTHADGVTRTTFACAHTGWQTSKLVVSDTTEGKAVAFEVAGKTRAIRFPIVPGHAYSIGGGAEK